MANITGLKAYLYLVYQKLFQLNLVKQAGGDFNTFNFWYNQINDNNADQAVSYPAIFFDIKPYDTKYLLDKVLEHTVTIDLYIAYDYVGGTRYGDPAQNGTLSNLGLIEKVHDVFDGQAKNLLLQEDYYNFFNLTQDEQYYDWYPIDKSHTENTTRYKSITLTKISYNYIVIDQSKHYKDTTKFTLFAPTGLTLVTSGITDVVGNFSMTPSAPPPPPTPPPFQSGYTYGYQQGYNSGVTSQLDLLGYWNSAMTYASDVSFFNSAITYINEIIPTDLLGYWTSAQTYASDIAFFTSAITYLNSVINYNQLQSSAYTLSSYNSSTGYTNIQVNSAVSYIQSLGYLTGATIDAYTKTQTNANFLSANTFIPTDFYSKEQSNANFLSANTSLFNKNDADLIYLNTGQTSNWLSANTSYYTQTQTNNNFLSANTSYYTQAQTNANFLSANTSLGISRSSADLIYLNTGQTANWLSANTSFYTQTQSNSNFLSANTVLTSYLSGLTDVSISGLTTNDILLYTGTTNKWKNVHTIDLTTIYYSITQCNANFLSANTFIPTDFYSKSQSNANFLSSNTSYYTQAQSNSNFLSAISFVDINTQGFVNNSQTQISFNIQTSAFTLSAITDWVYYWKGNRNVIQGNKTIILNTLLNTNFISIDSNDGTLLSSTTIWDLSSSKCPVAVVRIDKNQNPQFLIADERHTCLIPPKMHEYLHDTIGTRLESGGVPSGLLTTDLTTSKRAKISSAILYDEDLAFNIAQITPNVNTGTTDYFTMYRTSSAGTYGWKPSYVPFVINTGTNLMQWDNNGTLQDVTGGNGPNARYYNSYIILTTMSGNTAIVIQPGRGQFTSAALAQAEDPTTFDWTGLQITESYITYQLTWSKAQNTINSAGGVLYNSMKKIMSSINAVSVPVITASLNGLTDVTLTSPAIYDVLSYDGSMWVNSAVSYYTQTQSNNNFLSANTSFYTQTQANNNFLSANTSYYTQTQSNNNFLSANTSLLTKAQTDTYYLSANTSFYTQTQANNNFLSANTNYEIKNSANYLSANTSYYTQTQSNNNFLSANTSFYTKTQANANFVSSITFAYATMNLISGSFSHTVGTSPGLIVAYTGFTTGSTGAMTANKSTGLITVSNAGTYLINYELSTSSTIDFSILLSVTTWNNTKSISNVNPFGGNVILSLSANDTIGMYSQGVGGSKIINGYNLTVNRIG